MVMDARTGEVLHATNADSRLHPASLTKMMTLYVAFEAIRLGEISLDTMVTISPKAAAEPPSRLGLRAGQRIQLRYLIRAAAVKSANDAATAIAEAVSGSEAAFARRMNRTARALGMTRSTFKNAHGLTEEGHLSTARDMTILGRHLFYDYPQYYNIFSRRSTDAGIAEVPNTNRRFLDAYEGADGIKTGYTQAAGFNLVASAQRGRERIIATIFGATSTPDRNARMARLLDLGFERAPTRVAINRPSLPRYDNLPEEEAPAQVASAGGEGAFGVESGRILRTSGAISRSPVPRARGGAAEPAPEQLLAAIESDVAAAVASVSAAQAASDAATEIAAAAATEAEAVETAAAQAAAAALAALEATTAGTEEAAQTLVADAGADAGAEAGAGAAAPLPATPPRPRPAALQLAEAGPAPEAGAAEAGALAATATAALPQIALAGNHATAAAGTASLAGGTAEAAAPVAVALAQALPGAGPETAAQTVAEAAPDAAESIAPPAAPVALALAAPAPAAAGERTPPDGLELAAAVVPPELLAEALAEPEPVLRPEPEAPEVVTRASASGGRHSGISLGRFPSRFEAEKVLIATALAEPGSLGGALRRITQRGGGFEASFMGLSSEQAGLACRRLAARGKPCETIGG
ncbi:MAG: D-alanyl-D-alanine carboxypeptidase [Rhodobacteraceae bacterium]|nr:D-alanyl-D-alanine carboxypeptidase [Paracoccaceae bacterium]